jgi:hypothetical protein
MYETHAMSAYDGAPISQQTAKSACDLKLAASESKAGTNAPVAALQDWVAGRAARYCRVGGFGFPDTDQHHHLGTAGHRF